MTPVLSGPDRAAEARRLRQRYDDGATIRDLVADSGHSYCTVRNLLQEAGTVLRSKGARRTRT